MEIKNIFNTISSTIDKINDEKEKAKLNSIKRAVSKATLGVNDIKEIIDYILNNFFDSEEKIRDLEKHSIITVKSTPDKKEVIIRRHPHDTTDTSKLFDNEVVSGIENRGNLKSIPTALAYKDTSDAFFTENSEVHAAYKSYADGMCEKLCTRTINLHYHGKYFMVSINDGIINDSIGSIDFEV